MENNVNEYMSLPYSTVVVSDVTTDGEPCYMAYHPELECCMSHGDTLEEALRNLSEVTRLYIFALIDDGLEVPPPQLIDDGLEVPLPQGIMPNWEVVSPRTKHGEYVDLSPVITPP